MGLRCLCVPKCMFSSTLTGIVGVCAQRIHTKVFLVTVSQFSPMTLSFYFSVTLGKVVDIKLNIFKKKRPTLLFIKSLKFLICSTLGKKLPYPKIQ